MKTRPAPAAPALAEDTDEDMASLQRQHVLRAARRALAQGGLEVSMDDLALAAGVSRRSLFRHFGSRHALLGEALDSAFQWYEARIDHILADGGPLDDWLAAVLRGVHQSHLDAGRGFWQLAVAFDDDLPPEYSAANRRRRQMRRRMTERIANQTWASAGRSGPAPEILTDTLATVISSYTTHSMVIDRRRGLESVVQSGVAIVRAVIAAQAPAAETRAQPAADGATVPAPESALQPAADDRTQPAAGPRKRSTSFTQ